MVDQMFENLSSAENVNGTVSLRDLHHWSERIVGGGACTANLVLLLLLLTEPNPQIRRYSIVLVLNSIFDIAFALVGMVVELQMEFNDGYFLVILSGAFHGRSVVWRYWQLFVWVFHGCFACCQPPIIFIFRYMLIIKNRPLSRCTVVGMFMFMAFLAIVQAITYTLPFVQYEEHREKTCNRLLTHWMWHTGRPAECISTAQFSGLMIGALLYAILLVVCAYCIMIFTTVTIFRHMRNSAETMSAKTVKLQKQLNMILMVQITLPFLCGFVPVNVMALFPVLGITIHGAGILVPMFIGWVTFISPVTTALLVGSFRKRVARTILRLLRLRPSNQLLPTSISHMMGTNRSINNPSTHIREEN